jgi:hypothetical protein
VAVTITGQWTIADGVTRSFSVPGGRFTVDGNGPYDVTGPATTMTAGPKTVPVRESTSHLVGG